MQKQCGRDNVAMVMAGEFIMVRVTVSMTISIAAVSWLSLGSHLAARKLDSSF